MWQIKIDEQSIISSDDGTKKLGTLSTTGCNSEVATLPTSCSKMAVVSPYKEWQFLWLLPPKRGFIYSQIGKKTFDSKEKLHRYPKLFFSLDKNLWVHFNEFWLVDSKLVFSQHFNQWNLIFIIFSLNIYDLFYEIFNGNARKGSNNNCQNGNRITLEAKLPCQLEDIKTKISTSSRIHPQR